MTRSYALIAIFSTGLILSSTPAKADGFVAPSIGVDFSGSAGNTLVGASKNSSKLNVGVAAGWMGAGIIGVEEDFSYAPNFFGSEGSVSSTRVLTLMTNLIVGVPVGGQHGGGVRPYVSGGLGLINRSVESQLPLIGNFSSSQVGYDLGAGVMGYFANHIGMRGDIRYFRNIKDTGSNNVGLENGSFNFARASVGVLFRF